MFWNHAGMTVQTWTRIEPLAQPRSYCRGCKEELIARRPDPAIRRWHWAHKSGTGNPRPCAVEETEWHLHWKAVHLHIGWDIEVPVLVGQKRFCVDAMNVPRTSIREFVHSLSPAYVEKHRTLKRTGAQILWIFDGDSLTWEGRRQVSGRQGSKGYKHLLSPKACDLHREIRGLVHFQGMIWEPWKRKPEADIWYVAREGKIELAYYFNTIDFQQVLENAKPSGPREPVILGEAGRPGVT